MAICKDCERDTDTMLTLRGKLVRLNKDGICPTCVEVNAECAADTAEKLEKARAMVRVYGL
jgi:hypothetical protein